MLRQRMRVRVRRRCGESLQRQPYSSESDCLCWLAEDAPELTLARNARARLRRATNACARGQLQPGRLTDNRRPPVREP